MKYRILHIPTGLYYTPCRKVKNLAGKYCKSNLSKFGKIYRNYPSIGWTGFQIYSHLHREDGDVFLEAGIKDWKIVKDGQPAIEAPVLKTEEAAVEHAFNEMVKYMETLIGQPPPANYIENARLGFKFGVGVLDNLRKEFKLDGAL